MSGSQRPLWGDLHTHLDDLDSGDAILTDARENIDFCAVLCYPFEWDRKNGFRVESVQQRPQFLERWERIKELNRAHNDPGAFTTFLGHEWHGNRTRYGDHNVIYFDEEGELDDSWEVTDLFARLRQSRALALPHHTGYRPQCRSKDWDFHDAALSPVMEVFSSHGSSEGVGTPLPMAPNASMGPRATGGTLHDALARGIRIGVIASNDGGGLPGRWGKGRAGVWAESCTREAIWEAIRARRTFAVTGDRMELTVSVEGAPMGSVTKTGSSVDVEVDVRGSNAIDRLELIANGVVADTYCHSGRWESAATQGPHKVYIEAGWGPVAHYGFTEQSPWQWQCHLGIAGGRLGSVEPCFSTLGNRLVEQTEEHCAWHMATAPRRENVPFGMTQGIVAEVEGDAGTRLTLEMEGSEVKTTLGDLRHTSTVLPLLEESRQRVKDAFGLSEEDVPNPDAYYHNARKIKLHRAVPESSYKVSHVFRDVRVANSGGEVSIYVRASQTNGQMAWSSPIWLSVAT